MIQNKFMSRRGFLKCAGAVSASLASAGLITKQSPAATGQPGSSAMDEKNERALVTLLATAEALTATYYAQMILSPLYRQALAGKPTHQAYLAAGFHQEVEHYHQWVGQGATLPPLSFYYPSDALGGIETVGATLGTLAQLEALLVEAYTLGASEFMRTEPRALASHLLALEGQHHARAFMIAADLGLNLPARLSLLASMPSSLAGLTAKLAPFLSAGASGFARLPRSFRTSLPPDVALIALPTA